MRPQIWDLMPATVKIPSLNLTAEINGVNRSFYARVQPDIKGFLGRPGSVLTAAEHKKAQYIIANHLYLIHEYLNLGKVRDIDYSRIQAFATTNKKLTRYLFKKHFKNYSLNVLDSWIEPSVDIIECAMYRPSNRYNKHNYH